MFLCSDAALTWAFREKVPSTLSTRPCGLCSRHPTEGLNPRLPRVAHTVTKQ